MSKRVLFIATLHHPEQLQKDISVTPAGSPTPLFPTSMGQHYWERAMRKQGYEVDVFWRNLSGFGDGDISSLSEHVHSQTITPSKVFDAVMRRLPPQLNLDYQRRNQRLLDHARQFQPDIIWLSGDNTVILPETLAQLKQDHNCKILYVSGVSPIVFSHPIERQAARLYDLVLVNDYYHGIQWMELGAKQMECLPYVAIDPDFHYPKPKTDIPNEYLCDIAFVGTLVPDNLYSERVSALEALSDFDLGIWSVHNIPASLKKFHRGYALGDEMMQVLSSAKISLNIHGDFMRYGGNMRLFETAAIGAFQIVDNRPGIKTWFTLGKHLVTFEDLNALRTKASYYLENESERLQIAENARQHVLTHHTYDKRLTQVETLLKNLLL
jgi:hypothetical protein